MKYKRVLRKIKAPGLPRSRMRKRADEELYTFAKLYDLFRFFLYFRTKSR